MKITELLDEYWDLAFAEGKEGRDHDTINGDAQRVRVALEAAAQADIPASTVGGDDPINAATGAMIYRQAYTDHVHSILSVGEQVPYSIHLAASEKGAQAVIIAVTASLFVTRPEVGKDAQPHQQRLVGEKAAVDDKYAKLRDFSGRDDFVSIVPDEKERERLYRQSWILAEYSRVLGERIAAAAICATGAETDMTRTATCNEHLQVRPTRPILSSAEER